METKDFHSDLFDEVFYMVIDKYLAQVCLINPWKTPYDDVMMDFKVEAMEEGNFDSEKDVRDFIMKYYMSEKPLRQLKDYPDIKSENYNIEMSEKLFSEMKHLFATLGRAVSAISDRAADPSAKSFTAQQIGDIKKAAEVLNLDIWGKARDKGDVYDDLFTMAKERIDEKKIPVKWIEDVRNEIKDLSKGVIREQSKGLKI